MNAGIVLSNVVNKQHSESKLRTLTCKAGWFWAECTLTWLLWYFLLGKMSVAQKLHRDKVKDLQAIYFRNYF